MLKLSMLELFLRTIPEGFAFILASYALGRKAIDRDRYCISALLLGITIYLVRMLPIHFGVHTIIIIMIHILLTSAINKIETIKAVSAALVSTIIMFLSEWLNVFILNSFLNIRLEDVFKDPGMKLLYSSPSLIFFALTTIVLYRVFNKPKRGQSHVSN
ncbi:hypothetical protein [Fonticella tunisiensis]|uniref:Uncharacterized protein n=1 Tax=Fonticella tunisiensis TaxID=1096341 RepID=A0A4R7KQ80_9CLOT|nr:hypothetical protein [Fonticella tunisiensis]TDT61299.1 hypothetical protein EDD71_10724 [Fonticella tunisiensis]